MTVAASAPTVAPVLAGSVVSPPPTRDRRRGAFVAPSTGLGDYHARPIEAGRVDYLASSRRYRLNGGLSDDVKQALRELEL